MSLKARKKGLKKKKGESRTIDSCTLILTLPDRPTLTSGLVGRTQLLPELCLQRPVLHAGPLQLLLTELTTTRQWDPRSLTGESPRFRQAVST